MSGFNVRLRPDGARIIRAERELVASPRTVCDDLLRWAEHRPEALFLAERAATGWTTLSYGEALRRVRSIGAGLLQTPLGSAAPLAIVAENGISNALVALAALYVGIPVSPLSVGYASPSADPARLRDLLGVLEPGMVYAGDETIAQRVRAIDSALGVVTDAQTLSGDPASADAAFGRTGSQTVAKIMFTSGSTGLPKGVITTNAMLAINQTQTAMAWPEIAAERPIVVDWLPWSHTMGGSHIFGIVLRNGGALYIDDGRPVAGSFAASVRNLRDVAPTLFFSVPRGFTMLLEAFAADETFAAHFFSRLRGLGNAAAALPHSVRAELIALAHRYAPHPIRISSSWGMTESAPMATTSWGPHEPDTDTIGTPVPGVELKLAPCDGRYEIRVKGPNITSGYWRNRAATTAAFDEDGFYRTGDAGRLKDPDEPQRGVVFEGRLAENFKLSSGTWVNVGALRLALIERGAPIVEDVVLTGHDGEALGALVFLREPAAAEFAREPLAGRAEVAQHPEVRAFIAGVLAEHNRAAPASSTRIARALVLSDAPNRAQGEITEKGSVNQRRALQLRAAEVARLHAPKPDLAIITPQAAGGAQQLPPLDQPATFEHSERYA